MCSKFLMIQVYCYFCGVERMLIKLSLVDVFCNFVGFIVREEIM